MKSLDNQKGSSSFVIVLAVVVVAVGLVGYRVLNQANKTSSDGKSTTTTQATIPSKISNKAEIKQAGQALDAEAVDKNLDPSQLDADLNALY